MLDLQYDWVTGSFEPVDKRGHPVKLVDTVTCVVCGQKEYKLSVGKSARSYAGVCKEHEGNFDYGVSEKDEPAGKQAEFPKRK